MQVRFSASNYSELNKDTVIFSSDFTRAKESAEIARKIFRGCELHLVKNLKERFFGDFDKTSDENYEKVWTNDKYDSSHTINNVLERTTNLIITLEEKYKNRIILLVAHGDSLQILQTAFARVNPSKHRELNHLETAEIRKLILE